MISIIKHLSYNFPRPDLFLTHKAGQVWLHLDGQLSKRQISVTECAKAFLSEIKSPRYVSCYGRFASLRHHALVTYLLKKNVLRDIITCQPNNFPVVIRQCERFLKKTDFISAINKPSFCELLIKKVFKYKNYRNSSFCSSLYTELKFVKATCPYCNEYPVKIIQGIDKKKKKLLLHFDLDHFYPQHLYPYLALSFFNHIPCCKYCNTLHKLGKKFDVTTHIHPYERCIDELYTFTFGVGEFYTHNITKVKLDKNFSFQDQLVQDLDLESRYQTNVDYARLNRLSVILSDYSYLLHNSKPSDRDELLRLRDRIMDFGITLDARNILLSPLNKLQRDLVKFSGAQMKLLN